MTRNLTRNGRPAHAYARYVKEEVSDIIQTKLLNESTKLVRRRVGKEVDKTMGQAFRFAASQMQGGSNFSFGPLRRETGYWKPYNSKYATTKKSHVGHLRWFSLTGELAKEFQAITVAEVNAMLGSTRVRVSRDKKTFTITPVPNVRITKFDFEKELHAAGVLNDESLVKLENRVKSYRPMIGPVFIYFMRQRIPAAIRRAL